MYVWEIVSFRLAGDGWEVWHSADPSGAGDGASYRVHLRRPGASIVVSGLTLTEAYAAAARRAREHVAATATPAPPFAAPHFGRTWAASRYEAPGPGR